MPFGLTVPDITGMLAQVTIPPDFDVVLPTGRAVDPLGDPTGTRRRLESLRDAGATAVTCSVAAQSATHYCEQLAGLREIAHPL